MSANSHSFDAPELYQAVQIFGFYKTLQAVQTAYDNGLHINTANEAVEELNKFYSALYHKSAEWIKLA